jgi:cytochrome P450
LTISVEPNQILPQRRLSDHKRADFPLPCRQFSGRCRGRVSKSIYLKPKMVVMAGGRHVSESGGGCVRVEDWTAHGSRPIPGPRDLVSFDAHVDPLAFLGGLLRDYGDVVRYTTRYGASFLFAHPKHVQIIMQRENFRRASLIKMMLGDGLLASDGPHWRAQRQLMQKDFQPSRVAAFASVITGEILRTEQEWQTAAQTGEPVDIAAAMTRLTLRIIVKALFSHDLSDSHAADLCGAVTQTIIELGKVSWTIFGAPFEFSPAGNSDFAASKKIIDTTCYELIARRRAQTREDRPRDLLSLLLLDGEHLTDLQLRDEIVTMLVGGHETTALSLAWAWKLLAEHPAAEARLHRELDTVLADRAPHAEDLERLEWTRAVFQEAMRLYPPVWYMGRVAIEADEIDGYAIPRGACAMVLPWFTHRHPKFWQSPEEFDPTRFLAPAEPAHRYAYFPFAGGRHQCLGMHLAMMEGMFIVAQLSKRFLVRPVAGQDVRPLAGITLRQSPFMRARIELRSVAKESQTGLLEAT